MFWLFLIYNDHKIIIDIWMEKTNLYFKKVINKSLLNI